MTFKQLEKIILIGTILCASCPNAFSSCFPINADKQAAKDLKDSIAILFSLSKTCPTNVFEFRKNIRAAGLSIATTMVANRGYHNPSQGSFSFFEMVTGKLDETIIRSGDFFFGHFTTVNDHNELTADQDKTDAPRLMIEAFAWDANKEVFNFYELVGDGIHTQWFYRGNSADIFADNTYLHRQPDPDFPKFGNHLRCSACHAAGGPIMKEIHAPHNDWWEPNRKLDFGNRKFNKSILQMMANLVPPDRLAESVILGIKNLTNSNGLANPDRLSLQERLRPLFCPVEINFMSDMKSNDENNGIIHVPTAFFIDKKIIGNESIELLITRNSYEKALRSIGSHFPETSFLDADHAWLTPVKATSDQITIDHLINVGVIDEKFAADVLSIDMTNPVFSRERCALLKYVPNTWTAHWRDDFIKQLKAANTIAAKALLNELTNASHLPSYHKEKAMKFLMKCHEQLKNDNNVKKFLLLLTERRAELKASEISKNPRGQILEPGFRVIFPETNVINQPALTKQLNAVCETGLDEKLREKAQHTQKYVSIFPVIFCSKMSADGVSRTETERLQTNFLPVPRQLRLTDNCEVIEASNKNN